MYKHIITGVLIEDRDFTRITIRDHREARNWTRVASSARPTHRYDESNSGGDFLTSLIVAEVTDSAALGFLAGGDLTGAVLGDMLNDSDNSPAAPSFDGFGGGESGGAGASSSWDDSSSSSSFDSGSSDSGSSSDF